MPSVNTGNKIKSIKIYKDHVTLSFVKHEQVKISKEAFVSSYLYEGKVISSNDIQKLTDLTAISKLLNYALSLVSKRHYSKKKMYEKLIAKDDNKRAVMQVIDKLESNDLLDDKAYMQDLIAWDHERNFGENKIKKHLREQGIPESLISKAHFSQNNERKKAERLIPKLDKKYARYAYEIKKQHVYQALLSQGFNPEVARSVLDDVKQDKPKAEKEKLLADFKKIKKRYENKYAGYELKKKIQSALLTKGYKYSQIKQVLEEYNYENDF